MVVKDAHIELLISVNITGPSHHFFPAAVASPDCWGFMLGLEGCRVLLLVLLVVHAIWRRG